MNMQWTAGFCQHCTLLNWPALHLNELHCTVLRYAALKNCTALRCTVLHFTALRGTVLHCTALYCIVQHCTALHHIVLHCTSLPWTSLHCAFKKRCNNQKVSKRGFHCIGATIRTPQCLPYAGFLLNYYGSLVYFQYKYIAIVALN